MPSWRRSPASSREPSRARSGAADGCRYRPTVSRSTPRYARSRGVFDAMNSDFKTGEHDLLSFIRPDTLIGALAYLVIFVCAALILSRILRSAVHAAMTRSGHVDRTTLSFL